ncbi:hypothetical protein [Spiroplasma endosymbiont of 'Nebria riversi']|uniref:hypothetical protein n=1 Tax=Spiroplasma endosymbiont of 'Nebria riversi' TaxID=2792084 RepID=UPI001C059325|nr:hypothetical protein [Spiroplasma endosymbiont of 'Nebria riversi']
MFIGLVPLGAFFDTRQPPKPDMEQSFIKRQKRATNPGRCGKSCELEFAEILNSSFVNTSVSNYLKGWLQTNSVRNQLPSDTGYSDFYIVYNNGNGNIISSVFDFYKKNGFLKNKTYSIDKIVNVKITIASIPGFNSGNFWITSFSAEMPSLPQKDNEQPLPTEIT